MRLTIDEIKNPDFVLSARELSVVGAFLEIPVLYGIQSDILSDWSQSPEKKVKKTVNKMERRDLISCRIDGQVYIQPKLYHCVMCMGVPDWLIRIRQRNAKGMTEECFFYGKRENSVLLKAETAGRYNIIYFPHHQNLLKIWNQLKFPKKKPRVQTKIREQLSLELIREVKSIAEAFDPLGAEEFLKSHLSVQSEEMTRLVMDVINGMFSLGTCEYWMWNQEGTVKSDSVCYGEWKEREFRMWLEDNIYLYLDENLEKDVGKEITEEIIGGEMMDGDNYCDNNRRTGKFFH